MPKQLEELEQYWDRCAGGYSLVNQEELSGEQHGKWSRYLTRRFPKHSPETLSILDVGTCPEFFAIILAEAGYQVTAVDYTAAKTVDEAAEIIRDKKTK